MTHNELLQVAEAVSKKHTADIFLYCGQIDRGGYHALTKLCKPADPRRNALLILSTFGGDAHAAYRIARALRHNYQKLIVLIPGECKSAGTLIAIGASQLVISDCGELGPLDVQITKPDEIFERASGLDVMQSLAVMQDQAMEAFRSYLLDIKLGSGITLKAAAEMATKLAIGLFSPIYEQIDPVKLGETQRAILIAHSYGERLNEYDKNLVKGALDRLVSDYPSHGFVIDRKEARSLFKNVRAPTDEEAILAHAIYTSKRPSPDGPPTVADVMAALAASEEKDEKQPKPTSQAPNDSPRSAGGNGRVKTPGQRPSAKGNSGTKEARK